MRTGLQKRPKPKRSGVTGRTGSFRTCGEQWPVRRGYLVRRKSADLIRARRNGATNRPYGLLHPIIHDQCSKPSCQGCVHGLLPVSEGLELSEKARRAWLSGAGRTAMKRRKWTRIFHAGPVHAVAATLSRHADGRSNANAVILQHNDATTSQRFLDRWQVRRPSSA
jgi:hypothetical protein